MRLDIRTIITVAAWAAIPLTSGCGGKDKASGTIQMKDMEVVDGTATDAMTDLDGVKSEGADIATPAGNASNAAEAKAPPKTKAAKAETGGDAEVLADQ